MKTAIIFLMLLLAAGMLGCGRQPEPRHIVILPDVSGSIERESLNQAFKAIDDLVGLLHRGDRIAIIPIFGDADAEASGQIIRLNVPTRRQAYDSDLRSFRAKVTTMLLQMEADAVAHPASKTDILGTVELAKEELQAANPSLKKVLVVLSDFIQEDQNLDFRTDRRFNNAADVQRLAVALTKTDKSDTNRCCSISWSAQKPRVFQVRSTSQNCY